MFVKIGIINLKSERFLLSEVNKIIRILLSLQSYRMDSFKLNVGKFIIIYFNSVFLLTFMHNGNIAVMHSFVAAFYKPESAICSVYTRLQFLRCFIPYL